MSDPSDDGRSPLVRSYIWATQISSLGLELALPIGVGYWLDQRFGTHPWLLIGGAMLGIGVFGASVARLSRDWGRKSPDSPKRRV